jgi:hypothetical protein
VILREPRPRREATVRSAPGHLDELSTVLSRSRLEASSKTVWRCPARAAPLAPAPRA